MNDPTVWPASHPRRRPRPRPAHLSVALRREPPEPREHHPATDRDGRSVQTCNDSGVLAKVSTPGPRQLSKESSHSSGSTGANIQTWFDRSNRLPEARFLQAFEDDEPPYFLGRESASSSEGTSELEGQPIRPTNTALLNMMPEIGKLGTNGSSADDYRSVIDDLTIENRKLKERLRKYEISHTPHLDKDKLFEVKIHALPARKRRELEDTLRAFASSIDGSTNDNHSTTIQKRGGLDPHPSLDSATSSALRHSLSTSTSNSRAVDSAYASMSHSGPTSTSAWNHGSVEGKNGSQSKLGKDQKIQSYLHNTPEGHLSKDSPVMTERQKKKIVVRRLEQLFTGKPGIVGDHSQQHLQQQEVSNSAARADQAAVGGPDPMLGTREAQMLPFDTEIDGVTVGKLTAESINDTTISKHRSASTGENSDPTSSEQRPTGPLDLDPDRAQIPSDNLEYIRHLGLSTPKLVTEESGDAAADAGGWIYLNLLINMAQLHIISVTPDFVRAAVSEVSEQFQLSRDGKKVRWRGGSEGTRLSSDSGASSAQYRSPHDSDGLDEAARKRRKVDVGRFASAPFDDRDPVASTGVSGPSNSFQYKPLFHHRRSSSGDVLSSDDSDSPSDDSLGNDSSGVPHPRLWNERFHSGSHGRRRRDDGPIVFYSGAQFFTDLSGDRGGTVTPLHVTGVGKDGYSNHTQDALGCNPVRPLYTLSRTPSGSSLPSRPFKDYSRRPEFLQDPSSRSKTPELLSGDAQDLRFLVTWSSDEPAQPKPLLSFSASGLGGTRPADHFAVRVETRRSKPSPHHVAKSSSRGLNEGKILRASGLHATADSITSQLAGLSAFSSSPHKSTAKDDLPVKSEVVSTRFVKLSPSKLPEPSAYYNAISTSEDDSDSDGSSYSGISYLRHGNHFMHRSYSATSDPRSPQMRGPAHQAKELSEDHEMENEDEDTDTSIDMLAQAREVDPVAVAVRELEFEIGADDVRGG